MITSFKKFINESKLPKELVPIQKWLERSGIKTELVDGKYPSLSVNNMDGELMN